MDWFFTLDGCDYSRQLIRTIFAVPPHMHPLVTPQIANSLPFIAIFSSLSRLTLAPR
jgi:hypothetical protein